MTLHVPIVVACYAVCIAFAGIAAYAWIQVRSFLRCFSSLDGRDDLEEFKRVVKYNMYLALVLIRLVGTGMVVVALGLSLDVLGWTELQIPLLILGPICTFAGFKQTSAEKQLRTITLNDESLRPEFDHVVTRWTSSAFPDW